MAQDKSKSNGSDAIDENLRRVFQETVSEEVPDRFKDLLAQLKQQDSKTPGGDRTNS